MRVPTIGTASDPIFRGAIPLLCLLAVTAITRGEDPRRSATNQSVKRPSQLEVLRVKLKPTQKLRKVSQHRRPSTALQDAPANESTSKGTSLSRRAGHVRSAPTRELRDPFEQDNVLRPAPQPRRSVAQTSYDYNPAVRDVVVEPVCGLDPACGCELCVNEPTCGIEATCGFEPTCGIEAKCGFEPTCGIEPMCGCEEPCGGNRLSPNCCSDAACCGLRNFSFRGEYLLWWVDGFSIPPLLTTSTAGTSIDDAGVLGLASTTVLVGDQSLTDGNRSGGRFTANYWFDPHQTCGIEAIYTGLGKESWTYATNSQQYPILARPFFNVEPGLATQDAELIAYPDVLEGSARVEAESTLQSVEVLYRHAACHDCRFRLDWLVGWRHNRLDEELQFSDFKRVLSNDIGLPIDSTLAEYDRFETRNSFHGAELGVIAMMRHCPWTLEFLMKMALGNNHSKVGIDGQATFTIPGGQPPVTVTPAGLLAQKTNIGIHESDDFAVIPELGVTVGYDLNRCWRATLGYTFMYWSRVARPGDQIDTDLNLTQLEPTGLEGIARPSATGSLTDLWAQGLRVGLDAHF